MGNHNCYQFDWHYSNYIDVYGNIYPNIGIPEKFEVEDYEVFQVIKK
jgi:hypothetical protein